MRPTTLLLPLFFLCILSACGSADSDTSLRTNALSEQVSLSSIHLPASVARKYVRRPPPNAPTSETATLSPEPQESSGDPEFHIDPSCTVACYRFDANGEPEAIGVIPLPGEYEGRICRPIGHEFDDLSQVAEFGSYCRQIFPALCEPGACWVGGDTGGFVGRATLEESL